ncbi:hypothetical protein BDW22DRAFT_1425854 [Trametopsis cervina]|nr:hypothetical protein BDW22DRAFT_1425854 [Trametopsis cervina]
MDGDTYVTGSRLIVQWQATHEIISPTFKLCYILGDDRYRSDTVVDDYSDSSCGAAIQPPVRFGGDGSYQTELAVPSVTTATNFLLEMEDSYGGFSSSHTFTFTRMLTLNLSLRVTLKSQSVTQAFSSVSSALHNSSIGPPLVSSPVATRMTRPRGAISPAAYVVPLSISGIIVLAAITFGVYQRKKLKSEHSLQSQEFKMFKSQFTDNLGRLRGLSMWAAHLATGRHRGQTVANERAKVDDYFTHIYVPQFPSEKRAPKRTKVAQRGSSSLGSEPTVYSHTPNAQPVYVHGGRQHLNIVPEEDEAVNAEANHDIVSRYLHPSPMPPAPKPAHIRATSRDGRRRED